MPLWKIRGNGVIWPLHQLADDPEIRFGVLCRRCQHFPEQIIIHRTGTGEGEKFPAGTQQFHCQQIQIFISAGGFFPLGNGISQFRWIEDDRIEARQAMLDAYPSLRGMYNEDDGNTEVFYFKDATATFSSFTHAPETVKF